MTVNADFLISPAYSVPTMMISIRGEVDEDRGPGPGALGRRVGLERRDVDDREVRARSAASSAADGRRNRLRAKMLAQAVSV